MEVPVALMPNVSPPSGVTTYTSDAQPIHYIVKIQSFSLLAKNSVEKYESGVFEAGGYKWKLVLYPNGGKSKNAKYYISIYLAIADASSLSRGWEVYANFRLFLLDQNKSNYLIVEGNERRFHGLKLEWGFDELIELSKLNDTSNGYLIEDTCVFGAEVYVRKERSTGKGECLSMIKQPMSFKYSWKIDNFSKLDAEWTDSQIFSIGDQTWKIRLYPKGNGLGKGTHVSLYLALADPTTFSPASKVYAEFTLCILDQVDRQLDHFVKANYWFSASDSQSGWARFISVDYFYQQSNAFLVKDTCTVEAEIMLNGIAKAFLPATEVPPSEDLSSNDQSAPASRSMFTSSLPYFGSRIVAYSPTPDLDPFFNTSLGNLQSISAMPVYQVKSHEELRWEDYRLQELYTTLPYSKSSRM